MINRLVHPCGEIPLSNKAGTSDIHNHMDEPQAHCAERSQTQKSAYWMTPEGKAVTSDTEQSRLLGAEEGEELTPKGTGELPGGMEMLLPRLWSCIYGIYICQNSSNCTLKMGAFYFG